jgi:uncharacterized protein
MLRRWSAFARIVAAAVLAALAVTAASAQEPNFPAFTGYVVDDAGILTDATRSRLTQALADYHRATNRQIVVATVRSLQDYPIEEYGYRLGRAWGVGEKGKDTGAILLVAPNERQIRIEVGYGLEGELTDARSKEIIEQAILPAFRAGDFNRGVVAGTAALLRVLGAPATSLGQGRGAAQGVTGSDTGHLWGFLVPLLIFGLFAFLRSHSYGRRGYATPIIWGRGFGGGGFGSGGGFGGGGGGSFGGGGASGRW